MEKRERRRSKLSVPGERRSATALGMLDRIERLYTGNRGSARSKSGYDCAYQIHKSLELAADPRKGCVSVKVPVVVGETPKGQKDQCIGQSIEPGDKAAATEAKV